MSYNLLYPVHIIQAASMATSITSNPVEVKSQDNSSDDSIDFYGKR